LDGAICIRRDNNIKMKLEEHFANLWNGLLWLRVKNNSGLLWKV
jgi:hypothetical protein